MRSEMVLLANLTVTSVSLAEVGKKPEGGPSLPGTDGGPFEDQGVLPPSHQTPTPPFKLFHNLHRMGKGRSKRDSPISHNDAHRAKKLIRLSGRGKGSKAGYTAAAPSGSKVKQAEKYARIVARELAQKAAGKAVKGGMVVDK